MDLNIYRRHVWLGDTVYEDERERVCMFEVELAFGREDKGTRRVIDKQSRYGRG